MFNCSCFNGSLPHHKRFGLKRFFASTYQAVSGAGAEVTLLDEQIKQHFSIETQNAQVESIFPHPIAFNLIPHIDEFRADGYTKEELKMRNETKKILNSCNIRVSHLCPCSTYRAHSISINAEFDSPVNVPDARSGVGRFLRVELWDIPNAQRYPMPINYSEKKKFVALVD